MKSPSQLFFGQDARILALPNHREPRLLLESKGFTQRWLHSRLYPASRWSARAFRALLRISAASGLRAARRSTSTFWEVGDFVQEILPGVDAAVVSLGSPGPAQKVTAQLWEGQSVVAYLKFACTHAAKARLKREHAVLRSLPVGVGPRVLKYDDFADGQALLTRPVAGSPPRAKLAPSAGAAVLLSSLYQTDRFAVDQHPWVRQMHQRFGAHIDRWLEPLADQTWPVVFQHGDFTPWNVLVAGPESVSAIDWEYGYQRGFPHLDSAYWVLQVAALIRRWPAKRASEHATRLLRKELSDAQAATLVKLAAFDAYQQGIEDGLAADNRLQAWRRILLEAA